MFIVDRIDKEIKELQKVRRIVVKGEKRFHKEKEEHELNGFLSLLGNYDIPYSTFTYGQSIFVKIVQADKEEVSELMSLDK